jgi:hypothetical protein
VAPAEQAPAGARGLQRAGERGRERLAHRHTREVGEDARAQQLRLPTETLQRVGGALARSLDALQTLLAALRFLRFLIDR